MTLGYSGHEGAGGGPSKGPSARPHPTKRPERGRSIGTGARVGRRPRSAVFIWCGGLVASAFATTGLTGAVPAASHLGNN